MNLDYIKNKNADVLKKFLQSHNISHKLVPFDWLYETDYLVAPASKGYHAAYPGGLFDHSLNVAKCLLEFTELGATDIWSRMESPIIIGLLHDVTKISLYSPIIEGESITYVTNPHYSSFGGHGYDSVCKLDQHVKLTDEERACIRYHMGAYEVSEWTEYDTAIRAYTNVLWTHMADMYASKVMEELWRTKD